MLHVAHNAHMDHPKYFENVVAVIMDSVLKKDQN